MAASVRSWDAENGAENVTSVTLTDPDSGTSGDQILYWVFRQGAGPSGAADAPATPSGLTKRFDNIGTHGSRSSYSKHMEGYDLYDCDGSDQSETFTASTGNAADRAGVLARIAGVDSSTVQYHQTTAGNVANNGTLSAWKLPNGTTDAIDYVDGAITVIVVAFYDGNSDDQDVTIDDFTLDATTADMEVADGTTLRLFHRVWSGSGTSNPIIRNGTGGNIAPVALAWTFEASSAASQNIDGTAIGSAETHGGGAVTIGAVNLTGTAVASAEAFGTGEVVGPIDMVGTAIASAEAHGTGAMSGGVIDITGTAIVSAEAHGTGTVTGGEGEDFEVGAGFIGDHGPSQDIDASGAAIEWNSGGPQLTGIARKLYHYLATLDDNQCLPGVQNGTTSAGAEGPPGSSGDPDAWASWFASTATTTTETWGKHSSSLRPAIVGQEIRITPAGKEQTSEPLQVLLDAWVDHGIIPHLTMQGPSPYHPDGPVDTYKAYKNQTDSGTTYTAQSGDNVDLTLYLTPGTDQYNDWKARVDAYAQRITDYFVDHVDLAGSPAPVIFRPFNEMQGSWWWWAAANHTSAEFVALWQQLYDVLVGDWGLSNLIWVWAPEQYARIFSALGSNYEWSDFYPGDAYVHVTGVSAYHGYDPALLQCGHAPTGGVGTLCANGTDTMTAPGAGNWYKRKTFASDNDHITEQFAAISYPTYAQTSPSYAMLANNWALLDAVAPSKPKCLAEADWLVDPQTLADQGTPFCFQHVWGTHFNVTMPMYASTAFVHDTAGEFGAFSVSKSGREGVTQAIYNSPGSITASELPDWGAYDVPDDAEGVTVIQSVSSAGTTSPATLTISGTTADSLLIAVVRAYNVAAITTPTGWTAGPAYNPGNPRLAVFYRRAPGGDVILSAPLSASGVWNVQAIEVAGVVDAPMAFTVGDDTAWTTSEVSSPVAVDRASALTAPGISVVVAGLNVGSNPSVPGVAIAATDGGGSWSRVDQTGMGSSVYSVMGWRAQDATPAPGASISWTGSETYAVSAMMLAWEATPRGQGIASGEAHGTGAVSSGGTSLTGQAIASAEAHGTGAIAVGAVDLTGTAIASAEAHGTGTVNPGAIGLAGTAIASAEAHGTGTVTLTSSVQDVDGQAIASGEAHGTGAVSIGAVNVTGAAVVSAEVHGTGTVTLGTTIVGSALASGEAHGTGAVSIGDALLTGQAIASAEAHGAGAISTGTTTVGGQAIASAETFGLGQIVLGALIIGAAIAAGEGHGTGTVSVGAPPARRIRRSARRPDMSQSAREEGDN
jgi:hypothetical protein